MKRRTIFFLERVNPERYKVVAKHEAITPETLQPPKTHTGISISAGELKQCQPLGIPTLRRCLNTNQAFAGATPEPGYEFIALVCLKDQVDRRLLHDCPTLEEILDLCETFDGR